jgi:choline dehydrogenase-like flavoprotein
MYYQRGNPRDFDRWAEITGDPEWSFERVLPFFKSTANYHGNNPNSTLFSSFKIQVSFVKKCYKITKLFLQRNSMKPLKKMQRDFMWEERFLTEFHPSLLLLRKKAFTLKTPIPSREKVI